jgi:hypothetical protein
VVIGLLCSLGIRGGLILGITAADILISVWNSRHNISPPPKVYVFNRRIHHGEIGIFLAVTSLLLRGTSIPSTAAAILGGIGMGLVKDDYLDIWDWFRLQKKDIDKQKITSSIPKHEKEGISGTVKVPNNNDNNNNDNNNIKPEERSSIISETILVSHKDKQVILEPLQKQIRNLLDTYSEALIQIELQIKQSQKHLQVAKS